MKQGGWMIVLLVFLPLGSACGDDDGQATSPCGPADCSGHGVCDPLAEPPACECDDGYEAAAPGLCSPVAGVEQMQIEDVLYWAYNIQDVTSTRQYDELVGTHYDLYVLEVSTTEVGNEQFDMQGLIRDIRNHNITTRNVNPIVLAYVDVGQAEEWRWYYAPSWEVGNPSWVVADDPNGWEGNFVVAYWSDAWQDFTIYGDSTGRSQVEETLKLGFDGIYMDWVEAFSDENVIGLIAAEENLTEDDARAEAAERMLDFIENIGYYARVESPRANPSYLVVAQNASDLHDWNRPRYEDLMDGIALEAIWIDGDGGFDDWDDPGGYNLWTDDLYPDLTWTAEVLEDLQPLKAVMPIFCVEYAQDLDGENLATEVYENLALNEGFIPYATRRSLSRLSTTPYPPGYDPIDY